MYWKQRRLWIKRSLIESLRYDKTGDKDFEYSSSSTKHIHLLFSKDSYSIEVEMGPIYTVDEILSGSKPLFADAILKARVLYVLFLSKNIDVEGIEVSIDGAKETREIKNEIVFSLFEGGLIHPI